MMIAKNKHFLNIILLLFFVCFTPILNSQTIRINEVVSSNSIITDEDGDTPDWFEIHNYGTEEVSINGWSISDDANDLNQWVFPDITLSPDEYLLLWASSKNKTDTNFPKTIINRGDEFNYIIPTSEPNSNWKNLNFDDSNWSSGVSGFGYNDGDDATVIPYGTSSIYLRKEFTINDVSKVTALILDIDYDDAFVAYINGYEVARANIVGSPPSYNSGTITDHEAQIYAGGKPERFEISDFNSVLAQGQNVLSIQAHNISSNSSDFTIIPFLSAYFSESTNVGVSPPSILELSNSNLHTNFKISSSSETLFLSNETGTIVDQLTAENLPQNTSIGTSIFSGEMVSYIETTPGFVNSSEEYIGSIQNEVQFSEDSGILNAAINLELSGNVSDQIIRYTVDGTTPTETSTIYSNPIAINKTTTVKAQIYSENYIPSEIASRTYIINNNSFAFTDSNLPIVIITTENLNEIPNYTRIFGTMKIIQRPNGERNYMSDADNDDYLDYSGNISIETRGSSSQILDKKPYGFTTLNDDRSDNDNVELLGMEKENDWILNSFAYDDSMMRDFISYEMARKMGQYATHLEYCEVIVNGDYRGLYALSEKIKIDGDRVDIEKLTEDDNSFPEVTGGYLIQTDRPTDEDPELWYGNGAGYIIEKPNANEITNEQAAYIESVFRNFDQTAYNSNIITGYPSIIDVPSFIDYMLMAEVTSNADAYALSTFYHKDRGGKLRAGPVWDYNLTFGNDLTQWGYDRSLTNVWQFQYSNVGAYFWYNLFNNATFRCYLSKRFNEVTQNGEALNYQFVSNLIDETISLISEAVSRENQRWDTINDFDDEIARLKYWLNQRLTWMSNNLGSFSNCNAIETPELVITKIDYHPEETDTFPNSDDLEFIEITNAGNSSIDLTGLYFLKLGISYQFPNNATIASNQSIQIASNATIFQNKYGFAPFGTFERALSNKNQNLVLSDSFGNIIDEVEYFDKDPWPESADGDGFYLELSDINSDNSLASNWKASTNFTLSTGNYLDKLDISIYPNPFNDRLYFNSKQTIHKIIITNLLGQKIKRINTNFNSGEINLSELKKGVYFINLIGVNGGTSTKRILKN